MEDKIDQESNKYKTEENSKNQNNNNSNDNNNNKKTQPHSFPTKNKIIFKEKIIHKEVIKEVPVEKIVYKEIIKEVPVEKIIYKEIIKEVPVESTIFFFNEHKEFPIGQIVNDFIKVC